MWITHHCVYTFTVHDKMCCECKVKNPPRIHRRYCESVGEIQKWSCKWCYAWAVLNVNEFHHNICGMLLKCEIEILRLVSCLTQEVKNRFVCVCDIEVEIWLLMPIEFQSACVSCLVHSFDMPEIYIYIYIEVNDRRIETSLRFVCLSRYM